MQKKIQRLQYPCIARKLTTKRNDYKQMNVRLCAGLTKTAEHLFLPAFFGYFLGKQKVTNRE
jgi:hypothetical protein